MNRDVSLSERADIIRKATEIVNYFAQDKGAYRLYEAKEKAVKDRVSMLSGARREGYAKGYAQMYMQAYLISHMKLHEEASVEEYTEAIMQYRYQANLHIAKHLIDKNIEFGLIWPVTGLSIEELESIKYPPKKQLAQR